MSSALVRFQYRSDTSIFLNAQYSDKVEILSGVPQG